MRSTYEQYHQVRLHYADHQTHSDLYWLVFTLTQMKEQIALAKAELDENFGEPVPDEVLLNDDSPRERIKRGSPSPASATLAPDDAKDASISLKLTDFGA